MNIIPIVDIFKKNITICSEVTIQGWIRTRRDSKIGISFLTVYDGSCFDSLQVIVKNTLSNYKNDILRLTTGCSVSITGYITESLGNNQCYEVQAKIVQILGWIDNPDTYPISSKKHSMEYLRKVAHLRPRTNLIGAMSRIRNNIAKSIHNFMNKHGFLWISTPLITSSDTEGVSEMFHVSTLNFENLPRLFNGKVDYSRDFFSKESFLTVSGQLNGESYACALSKIYTFGPTFRAENSNTSRHLAEFWMVEPEIAFSTLDDIIDLSENMIKYIFQKVLIECINDIQFFNENINKEIIDRLEKFININFVQIDYTEAINILKKYNKNFEKDVYWGINLSFEHENFLTKNYFRSPIVIKNHPKKIKSFYMRVNNDDKTVASMDILFPDVGEIIGGSQREERLDFLDKRLEDMCINKEKYWWYRDLRRYGTVPHSGFGLGLERLIMYTTGIRNIRDVIPFPCSQKNSNF